MSQSIYFEIRPIENRKNTIRCMGFDEAINIYIYQYKRVSHFILFALNGVMVN